MIHLQDDFFEDPYLIRSAALKSSYASDHENRWPGWRSLGIPQKIADYLLFKARSLVGNSSLEFFSSTFQYTTKEFEEGIFHADPHNYICIIYLSLDPSLDSGTEVCDSDETLDYIGNNTVEKLDFIKDPYNLIKRYRYDRIRRKVNSHYKPIMKVPNKFNRGIIFPATNFHRAQHFFGTFIESARMTSVSFFH